MTGQGTVDNAGSLIGGSGTAVSLSAGFADRVAIAPGAYFAGIVDGGNTIGAAYVSTLELTTGAGVGTLTGLGTRFIDFGQVTVDPGANWVLSGYNSLAAGVTLIVSSSLSNTGTLAGDVTLASGAYLYNAATGTIIGNGTAAVYDGSYGAGAASVVNAGLIDPATNGVYLAGGGSVNNVTGGTIEATQYGIFIKGGTGTVENNGSIIATGTDSIGIELGGAPNSGGNVTNHAGISAGATAVEIGGSGGTVTNFGTISATSGAGIGVELFSNATVVNHGTGVIYGGGIGVYARSANDAVENAGTITGGTFAVTFASGFAGDRLIVDPGAYFSGTVDGGNTIGAAYATTLELATGASIGTLSHLGSQFIDFAQVTVDQTATWTLNNAIASGVTLTNNGTIDGQVSLAASAYLTNASTGTISASSGGAVYVSGSATVANAGSIYGSNYAGVLLRDGGLVVNQLGGVINGSHLGIDGAYGGAAPTIINAGSIAGLSNYGIELFGGGAVTNQSSGTITGQGGAIFADSHPATVVNAGRINGLAGQFGVFLQSGGAVTNQSGGNISGGLWGVLGQSDSTVINAGTITSNAFGVELRFGSSGTVVNAGTIAGGDAAVLFQSDPGNLLVVDPGATFSGAVNGGNTLGATYASTLELASGATAGTLSGLGSQITSFANITIDSGATWTLASDALGTGYTINDSGTLTNTGSLGSAVTLTGAALINAASATIATSGYAVTGQGTLANAGSISGGGGTAVSLGSGFADRVVIYPNAVFTGIVDGGNTIGAAYASTLELASGATAGTLTGLGTQYIDFANITIDGGATWTLASDVHGASYTINDSGTLTNTGSLGSPVTLGAGAVLTNATSGMIATIGIAVTGQGTVVNAGQITSSGTYSIDLTTGTVTNLLGGTIAGYGGIYLTDGTVINAGSIHGAFPYDYGVSIDLGAATNESGGTITGGEAGLSLSRGPGTNAGYIGGTRKGVDTGGSFANEYGGTIIGGRYGLILENGGTLTNAGSIDGQSAVGVHLYNSVVTNQATGTITGGTIGVYATNGAGTVVNAGSIGGGTYAVNLQAGYSSRLIVDPGAVFSGTVDGGNTIGATIASTLELASGTIAGTLSGLGSNYINFSQLVVNPGATWIFDPSSVFAGTLTNAGTIGGSLGSTPGVVQFAYGYPDRLIMDPGASFEASVNGGNGFGSPAASTLELTSGASAGTLSGLGSQYYNFTNITIDSGATWTLVSDTLGAGYSINDAGTLTNTGSLGSEVFLASGATLTNASTGSITVIGNNAVYASGGPATVVNAGAIYGSDNTGVELLGGGQVINQLGGSIGGSANGIYIFGTAASVINAGSIAGLSGYGVQLTGAGGNVTNLSGGTITGVATGVRTAGTAGGPGGTVVNAGLISGYSGVLQVDGGVVTNQSGGDITGSHAGVVSQLGGTVINAGSITGTFGVDLSNGAGTVINAGYIGGSYSAVFFGSGYHNRLVVDPGATFSGLVNGGNTIGATYASTLELASGASAGTLNALGSQYINFAHITIDGGATWTFASDTLGAGYLIYDRGTLTNTGSLGSEVALGSGAVLTNASGATITGGTAVYGGHAATVVNGGYIAGYFGIYLHTGGAVTNQSGGTIYGGIFGVLAPGTPTLTNAGSIYGYEAGVFLPHGGAITNQASGTIIGEHTGVYGYGATTLVNAGSIGGTIAVYLGYGTDLLVVDPGAVFSGAVNGGNPFGSYYASTLELASGTSAGTLSGLGSKYYYFSRIVVDPGATWTFYASSPFAGTLTNAGTIDGSIGNTPGVVQFASGYQDRLIMDPGASFDAKVNGGNTLFASADSTLELASGASAGTLSGLGSQYYNFASIRIDSGATWTLASASLGTYYSIFDAGTLTNTGSLGSEVQLGSGAGLTNASGATIAGGSAEHGIYSSDTATVVNAGYIYGSNDGVNISGGAVTNQYSGTIIGGNFGVLLYNAATLTNAGSIGGQSRDGVYLYGGGVVTNQATGTITGGSIGVYAGYPRAGGSATVVNAGSIGGGTYAVDFQAGYYDRVVVDPGAVFSGIVDGGSTNASTLELASGASAGTLNGLGTQYIGFAYITIDSGATWTLASASLGAGYTIYDSGTLTNAGSLGSAVTLGVGAVLTNASGATIAGGSCDIGVYSVDAATVVNAGYIAGTSVGVDIIGALTNQVGGTIVGGQYGVQLFGGYTLTNAGSIDGQSAYGVHLYDGGAVTNLATGTITGGTTGVYVTGGDGTVVNAGSIGGGTYAVTLQAGYSNRVVVDPGAVFSGTVDGGNALGAAYVSTLELASGTSAGTLSGLGYNYINFSQLVVDPGATWIFDPSSAFSGTLTNAGTIGGSIGSTPGVVQFTYGYADRLIMDPGASFDATVNGGNAFGSPAVSTLELASGASAGTLSGLGSQYINFTNITIDSAATWTLAFDAIGAGYTIHDSGTLTNTGSLGSEVTLGSGAVLTNASGATITGNSGVYGASAATVSNAGHIIGDYGIFLPGGGAIANLSGGTIYGSIAGVATRSALTLTNAGSIGGRYAGVYLKNGGAVTNQASGTITGDGNGVFGASTVVNAGSIGGGTDAVYLQSGYADLLVVDPTAVFSGNVNGGNTLGATAASTLELASAASAGTLSGLGTQYIDFANITIDSGATWTLASASLGAGYTINDSGTLTNTGSLGSTVTLSSGAALTNASGATIAGHKGQAGVYNANGANVVINAGYITGQMGVALSPVSTVINQAGGTITGVYIGVSDASTLVNAGSIGGGTDAVYLQPGYAGLLVVDPGAVFSGTVDGGNTLGATAASTLELASGASAGTLSGLGSQYIDFANITIDSGATWTLASASLGAGYTINDSGTLTNTGSIGSEVYLASGALTNASGATIAGGSAIAAVYGANYVTVTVMNAGYISGTTGVNIIGALTNQVGGTIVGGQYGVQLYDGFSLTNAGSIDGQSVAGVRLSGGGTVTNQATGTITGGTIGASVTRGAGTVVNAGSIGGGTYAVKLQAGDSNWVVIDPGAVFSGIVSGGNTIGATAASTLELASGASAGTLSGLGSQYIDFTFTTVDANATWTLAATDTIVAGATLTELSGARLTDTAALINYGAIVLDPSTLHVADLSGTGTATLDAGSTLTVQTTLAAGQTVAFDGTGAYLHLQGPSYAHGSVTNFELGDTIDLAGVNPASVTYSSGTVSFDGGSFPLDIVPGNTLIATPSGDGAELSALCFRKDTRILTPSGERRVQDLAVGDLVLTYRGEKRPIAWIGTGQVLATRGRRNAATPVIIKKGALDDNVPNRDLHVTKGHAIFVADVLIPVEFLVNHRSILWDDLAQEVTLYHIELETHDVLIADGAPAESYRDDGNRWLFRNSNSGWDLPAQEPCAPLLTGGPLVDEVWRWLLDRAGPRPGTPTTDEPDLHLLVDGQRVDPVQRSDNKHVFRLAVRPNSVRIVSRAGAPQELGLARDPRPLGAAIQRVVLRKHGRPPQMLKADDARLTDGFHEFEPDKGFRWTNGNASLPMSFFRGISGACFLEIDLAACTTLYSLLADVDEQSAA